MAGAQVGDELSGVLGGVDSEGFRDGEEGLRERGDGELLTGALGGLVCGGGWWVGELTTDVAHSSR